MNADERGVHSFESAFIGAAQMLSEAEVVLGVVGAGLTEACRQELNTGRALNKNMIVMSGVRAPASTTFRS
jgi:hypothetical protein